MDYGTFRGIYTVILLVIFIGIAYWAYHRKSNKGFDDAAKSIFEDEHASEDAKLSSKQESNNE